MYLLYFAIIFFGLHVYAEAVPNAKQYEGHCAMSFVCSNRFGEPPCLYSGPPLPLNQSEVPNADLSIVQVLRDLCPEFAFGDDPLVCCDTAQLLAWRKQIGMVADMGLHRCPSCMHNFRQLVCNMWCSPWQSRYLEILETEMSEGKEAVKEINFHISKLYAYEYFDSCKGIKGLIPGTYFLDFGCGSWGHSMCSPERWTSFMGSTPDEGGFSPYKTNYIFHIEDEISQNGTTYFPFKEKFYKCHEKTMNSTEACSCNDCDAACFHETASGSVHGMLKAPSLPSEKESLTILGFDGLTVIAIILFLVSLIFISVIFLFRARLKQSESKQQFSNGYDKSETKLGTSEEFEPLHVKKSATTVHKPTAPEILKTSRSVSNLHCCTAPFDAFLAKIFSAWARFVLRNPFLVIAVSLFVALSLSSGVFVAFDVISDPIELSASKNSEARKDMEYFNEHFGLFYRIEQIIMTPKNKNSFIYPIEWNYELLNVTWGPALEQDFFNAALDLQMQIENLTAEFGNTTVGLKDICLAPLKPINSECVVQSPFAFYQNNPDRLLNKREYLAHFKSCVHNPQDQKCFATFGGPIESAAVVLGGFTTTYDTAEALLISIPVMNYRESSRNEKALAWEKELIKFLKNFTHPTIDIAFRAERSIGDETGVEGNSDTFVVALCYILMFCYIMFALGYYRGIGTLLVDSKFTLGFFTITYLLLSITSSFGLSFHLGLPVTLVLFQVVPFLVLSVAVNHVFLLIQTFQSTVKDSKTLEDRISSVAGKVFPSIFISVIAMAGCFLIGSLTEKPILYSFAMTSGISMFVTFILYITFFFGIFVLDAKRQERQRLDILCCVKAKTKTNTSNPHRGIIFKWIESYSTVLMKNTMRFAVMLIFSAWLFSSVAVVDKIEIGLDQKLSVPKDSYLYTYFKYLDSYLSVGPPLYFIIKGEYNYADAQAQSKVCSSHSSCDLDSIIYQLGQMAVVKNRTYIALQPISWVDNYLEFLRSDSCCYEFKGNKSHCPSHSYQKNRRSCKSCRSKDPSQLTEEEFNRRLQFFVSDTPGMACSKGGKAMFGTSIEIQTNRGTPKVMATHFMTYNTVLKKSKDFYESLRWARIISSNLTSTLKNVSSNADIQVIPYSLPHVYFEQYLTIWDETVSVLGLSVAVISLITLLLLGFNLYATMIVTGTILCILINTMGLMYWCGISLNALSQVNLVLGVGLSVEFCLHVTRSFVMSYKTSNTLRAQNVLSEMGTPVLLGITFSNYGLIALAFANAQMLQVFYFRMFIASILIGALHGLVFLPVFLSLLGPLAISEKVDKNKGSSNHELKPVISNKN